MRCLALLVLVASCDVTPVASAPVELIPTTPRKITWLLSPATAAREIDGPVFHGDTWEINVSQAALRYAIPLYAGDVIVWWTVHFVRENAGPSISAQLQYQIGARPHQGIGSAVTDNTSGPGEIALVPLAAPSMAPAPDDRSFSVLVHGSGNVPGDHVGSVIVYGLRP